MQRTLRKACGTVLFVLLFMATGWAQVPMATPPSVPPPPVAEQGPPPAAAPVIDKQEEGAYKAFYDLHSSDAAKQIQLGEDFAKKYPSSRYLASVYSTLALDYMTTGAGDKIVPAAQKAIERDPDNVDALSLIVWASARTLDPSAPGAAEQILKVENYAHHAIKLLTSMTKPAGVDDAQFAIAKNDNLAMCHSGLGVIDFKQQKYADAVAELAQAVQLAETPDPVDYFVLGHADEATSHFSDAMAAFSKCTDQGPLQDQCKAGLNDAKQKASQAPSPKS
jgi:tetratricopeptide (TPR) repeat protein